MEPEENNSETQDNSEQKDSNIQNCTEKTGFASNDNLSAEEMSLVEIIIKNPFASNIRLAEITGLHRHTIFKIKNRPHVQDKIKEFSLSNIEKFQEIQEKALNIADELMDSEKDYIKWQAAKPFVESLETTKLEVDSDQDLTPIINLIPVKPD